ncbi:sodium- and chloride-dependent neutral and basic amino acid transporter B(0+)-like [Amphiura filiformis]|uniref:sodium- and chloride-dependent neutral and basic amino acid transporter B(0+)-like n=1 Tax=Amphiura filiformis TaxID=82378 RepID=UPI003B221AE0
MTAYASSTGDLTAAPSASEFKSEVELLDADDDGDENKERGNWGSKMDFVLSCLGYAVGLGNVWRFPYLAYRNGGGAFLVPYVIMLAFAGLPLFLLEVAFGQYCSSGPITCWRSVPIMRGIGYGQIFVGAYVAIYYNVIITYTIYYFFASFARVLPWVGCHHDFNTLYCSDLYQVCVDAGGIVTFNGTCVQLSSLSNSELGAYNITKNFGGYNTTGYSDPLEKDRVSASEEYWKYSVLHESPNMNEQNGVVWGLALSLLAAWILIFFCLIKGIKSSGKVVYFTATFPYLVLVILLIRGLTLPGYEKGIKFFVTPDFKQIGNAQVWLDAAVQIFYSLSAASGGLVTLSSYNKFKNDCYFDSLFVAVANCCTSVFAGFVIFSIIGFMAHELGKEVDEVVDAGFGLAFIAYPAAVARMPVPTIWSLLFFFMLLTLGLDSQFTIMENVVTAIVDEFPDQLRKRKVWVMLTASVIGYILGLTCVTTTGPYWVALLDSYGAGFPYLVYALMETVAIAWLYGVKRFVNDVRVMIGDKYVNHPTFFWWPICWCALTPALMTFVLMFNFINWSEPEYNGPFPPWARGIGWMVTLSGIIWIPLNAIWEVYSAPGNIIDRLRVAANPSELWGPALQRFRNEAAEVHKLNGTTMGGRVLLPSTKNQPASRPPNGFNVPEKSVKYNPRPSNGFNVPQNNPYPDNGRTNPGFDSPMA